MDFRADLLIAFHASSATYHLSGAEEAKEHGPGDPGTLGQIKFSTDLVL